uniref:DnaJ heat shock protein family (Hsp40) member C4 n=1 Tax=Podarcis muralis TaxID=64176 RepID=A0A670JYH2_PODMU
MQPASWKRRRRHQNGGRDPRADCRHLPRTRVWRSSEGLNMTLAVPFSMCRCCWLCQSARHRVFSTAFCSRSPARNSSYYDLLGIKQDATLEEIKQAFFSKSKKLHPDSDPGNPELHSQFVKLNEAYRVLSKASSRRRYDSTQAAQEARPPPGSHGSSTSSSARRKPFDLGDFGKRSASEPNEDVRYWQQFHHSPSESFSGPEYERKRRQNRYIFGYCLLVIVGGLAAHYIGFRYGAASFPHVPAHHPKPDEKAPDLKFWGGETQGIESGPLGLCIWPSELSAGHAPHQPCSTLSLSVFAWLGCVLEL